MGWCAVSSEGEEATPVTRSDIAEIIDPAAEIAYRQQLGREMYEKGRRDADADMAERWAEIARPASRSVSRTEMEERRWGPGGRERFGDPRPGDYPGRGAEALNREAETELEAGS